MTTPQQVADGDVLDGLLKGDLLLDESLLSGEDLSELPWHELIRNDTLLDILNLSHVINDVVDAHYDDAADWLPPASPERNETPPYLMTSSIDDGSCGDANSFYYVDLTQITSVHLAFVALYAAVIALSIVGNIMVVVAVWRHKHMRTVTNCYIANLAVCDLLVSFVVMPLKLLEYAAPCRWNVFNTDAMCSLVSYVLPVFVFASVLTLVATSVERYYAIVHPLSSVTDHSKSRTRRVIIAVWIVPMVLASPYLYHKSFSFDIYSEHGRIVRQICQDRFDDIDLVISSGMGAEKGLIKAGTFRKWFFVVLFLSMYAVPSLIITVTCIQIARCLLQPIGLEPHPSDRLSSASFRGLKIRRRKEENKRKVARMIIAVSVVFLLCWTPHYVVSIVSQLQAHSFLRHSNFVFTMLATHLVGFLNSCINPMIYNSMSEKFRNGFRLIICRLCCSCVTSRRRRRRQQENWKMRSDYGGTEVAPGGLVKQVDDGRDSSSTAPIECTRLRRWPNNNNKAYKSRHQQQQLLPLVNVKATAAGNQQLNEQLHAMLMQQAPLISQDANNVNATCNTKGTSKHKLWRSRSVQHERFQQPELARRRGVTESPARGSTQEDVCVSDGGDSQGCSQCNKYTVCPNAKMDSSAAAVDSRNTGQQQVQVTARYQSQQQSRNLRRRSSEESGSFSRDDSSVMSPGALCCCSGGGSKAGEVSCGGGGGANRWSYVTQTATRHARTAIGNGTKSPTTRSPLVYRSSDKRQGISAVVVQQAQDQQRPPSLTHHPINYRPATSSSKKTNLRQQQTIDQQFA